MKNKVQALITFDTSYFQIIDFINEKYGKDTCTPNEAGGGKAILDIEIEDICETLTHIVGVNKIDNHKFVTYGGGISMEASPLAR